MSSASQAHEFLTPDHLEQWFRVQDSFSRISGLSVWTIDPRGKVIGQPSTPPALCLLLRGNAKARQMCNGYCIRNCRRSLRNNAPTFFRCHANLLCFASPLRVGGHPVGVILGGQILTASPAMDTYRALAERTGLPEDSLMKAVSGLTIGNEKVVRAGCEFVTDMAEVVFSGWEANDRAHRKLTMLTNVFTLSSEFSPEMDTSEIYALILNSLSVLFDLESAALFIEDHRTGLMLPRYAFGPNHAELMGMRLTRGEPFLDAFFRKPEPLVSDDYYLLLRAGFPETVRQLTIFPLFSGEQLKGMLAVFNRLLDAEERRMVAYFVNQATLNIQNVFLRDEVRKKFSTILAFNRLNEKLSRTMEMDELLSVIFEEAANLARAEKASLMVMNEKSRQLMVRLVKGERGDVLRNYAIPVGQGLAGQVAKTGEPMLVKNLEEDARFGRLNRPHYRTPSFLIMPLKAAGRTLGILNVTDKTNGESFDEDDLSLLGALAAQASVALERSELFELSRELKKISITDALTGLLNRRYFQERATEEIDRSKRYGQPLALVMIDVDDFKFYNDRHGHPAGDDVLKTVGAVIKSTVRTVDVVARYGGEEFAILSPNTSKNKSFQTADRVRKAVLDHVFPREREQPGGDLTISLGLATYPDDAGSLDELISHADKALYLSKKAGKNRVTAFDPTR
jgi:diguanylate cyclase (GGDEF)-like protein